MKKIGKMAGLAAGVTVLGWVAMAGSSNAAPGSRGAVSASSQGGDTERHAGQWSAVTEAAASLHPTQGHMAGGTVRFHQVGDAVEVSGEITGLEPGSRHGFHIHEFGDCSRPDGKSAGGHYNPDGYPHGSTSAKRRHAGDMGNIEADASGKARFSFTFNTISVAGLKNPVIGRGVIVHAAPDDYGQPTGHAGARLSCGVIGIAHAEETTARGYGRQTRPSR
ncbi:MAG: superoxide dismutase family protein [Acidobacteriota bacterium]